MVNKWLCVGVLFLSSTVVSQDNIALQDKTHLPNGATVAVSLSYDDALNSQLDNAVPALNKYGIKASFYLVATPPSTLYERMPEWRLLAEQGHELGNHTLYHPCSASQPDRDWVSPHADLDKRSVAHMVQEVSIANTLLKAIDGKTERTITIPCGDHLAGGESYLPAINDLIVAIKGQGVKDGTEVLLVPSETTGKALIDFVKNVDDGVKVINIIFHGVGGDYLSVSPKAHEELVAYLAAHRDRYWVDTYINIMQHLNND